MYLLVESAWREPEIEHQGTLARALFDALVQVVGLLLGADNSPRSGPAGAKWQQQRIVIRCERCEHIRIN